MHRREISKFPHIPCFTKSFGERFLCINSGFFGSDINRSNDAVKGNMMILKEFGNTLALVLPGGSQLHAGRINGWQPDI